MSDYVAQVLGSAGSPVVLMPGGGAPSKTFFPHLEKLLVKDHRVVLVDRPGTGLAIDLGRASLPSGSAAYAEVLRELDAGPALVVGQSLGGAMAVQFATDHPELVSGLVLIDPTPVNAPKILKSIRPLAKVMCGLCGLPVVGPRLEALLTLHGSKAAKDADTKAALQASLDGRALYVTGKAIDTLEADGAALTKRLAKLDVPVVVMTADRKPGHAARVAHEQLAAALGGRVVTWPGATHGEHLREPQKVVDLVTSVLTEVQTPA